ncbi:MAG: GNAT family N-acetyltransferase [Puniceicoccales bacterium]|nr:GNAT family N-acetyltransferase [Puniceicoccales bacterium]
MQRIDIDFCNGDLQMDKMNKKSIRYCWAGVVAFLIGLAAFEIGKQTGINRYHGPSHHTTRNNSIPSEKGFEKYVLNPSLEVLHALEEKANGPSHHTTRNNSIPSEKGFEKYVLNPSPEVLHALEEKAKHPDRESDSHFRGLAIAPILGTERLVLRGMNSKDLDDLTEIFSDYETIYMLAFMPWPFDRNRVKIYMMNLSYAMESEHSIYWAITLPGEDRLIGVIGLTFEHEHDRAEMHFWLAKKHRSKGYMTEVARRIVDYVFRDLELNRLDINHLNVNIGSQRVIEKCGFKLECEKDDFCKKGSQYENMKFYRLLRREYLAAQE